LNAFVLDPKNHDVLSLIKGIRNGIVYGSKVRFPHALVMIFLFRSGTFRQKALLVLKATRQHAHNLALFALIYKSALHILLRLSPHQKPRSLDPFVAGMLGGYVVFGRSRSSVSQQIVIYVFARSMLGLAKLAIQPRGTTSAVTPGRAYGDVYRGGWEVVKSTKIREAIEKNAWPVFASMSWAGVMWLFWWHPDVLQPSLRSSMNYIYVESDTWDSFRTLVWHNK